MSQLLSQTRLRLRVILSSIGRVAGLRLRYKIGFTFLGVCLLAGAKFGGVSEAKAAVRHYIASATVAAKGSSSDTTYIFGPKQFLTVKSNSQVNYVESFAVAHQFSQSSAQGVAPNDSLPPAPNDSLPPTQGAFYKMLIRHVGGSLTTANVSVNGTQVAVAADFASATSIERIVLLNTAGSNTLSISLKGAAAAGLVVTIFDASSASFDVFGPTVYQKTATTPTHFVESFPMPPEASFPYRITASASASTTKATITLNGVQVINDVDFTGTGPVSRDANLVSGNNSMMVDVRGNTGTTITVEITATDQTPPILSITTPSPNLVTNANSLTVTGTSQDRSSTQVKVNGVTAAMSGTGNTQFSANVPLAEGVNTIAIQATDRVGNHADSTRTVTRDTLAPALTVTSPGDGSYTNQDAVTVAGAVSDASTVTVKVNGVSLSVGQGGAFSGSYTLVDGANFLTIAATDAGGNVTSQVRKVTQAKQPPVLTVSSPAAGFVKNASPVTVSGTVTGTTPITVSANGVGLTVTGTSFSGNVPLVQGANDIAITATDPAGNTTVVHRNGRLDTQAPVLTLTAPANASYSNAATTTVTGTVTDESTFTVTVNGTPVTVGANGAFSQTVNLATGVNQITVTATDAASNVSTAQRTVTQDVTAPTLAVSAPNDGSYSNATSITVSGAASDANPLTLSVNGNAVSLNADGSFAYNLPLVSGANTISVVATDGATNLTSVSRTVIQDRDAPTFSVESTPDEQSWTHATSASITVTPVDASPITVTLDNIPMTVDANGKYSMTVPLTEAASQFNLQVTDAAGNTASRVIFYITDTHAPTIDISSPVEGAHFETEPVLVDVSIQDGGKLETFTINGASVDPEGPPETIGGTNVWHFSTQVHLVPGSNSISFVATDAAGNTSALTRTVTFGTAEVLPPDPATVAPALDPTVATTTFAATSFLYSGANPIQTGVVAGTIQPLQTAMIRGSVRTRSGEPLSAVKITVLDHPEFGQTLSRADGAFDLVVNGGAPVTLHYEKSGFLPVRRQAAAHWQEYVVVEPVTLVSLDPIVTTINVSEPDSSQPAQVAQGGVVTDASGTRQATMIFKGGTHASLKMPDGTLEPMTSISVRETEYTVGPTGQSAMPAPLPATSGYTYAVELSADEAIAAGAKGVVFDRPVAFYVDNFLHFPVGKPVPVGFYDRDKAQWVAAPNGRIVQVIQVANGRATLDVDGSGTEATPEALAAIGVDDAELTQLGALYAPGKSFWRVQLSHFSGYDLNWAYRVNATSKPPKRPDPKKKKAKDKDCPKLPGSVIGCERQTLGESIAIAGTSLRLNYQSDGTPGYKEAYSTDISLIGDTVPQDLRRIELQVVILGQLIKQTYAAAPNQTAHLIWDGNDVYGRPVHGTQTAQIRIGYTYAASSYDYPQYPNANGDFGAYGDSPLTGDPARFEVTLWQELTSTLGVRDTRGEGLAGWSLDIHHYYDPVGKVLQLGNGERRSAADLQSATTTIAGADCTANCTNSAKPGDKAASAFISAEGMAVASDGTMYLADDAANKIWRVNTAGLLELVGGDGTSTFSGDGIPATSAGMVPNADLKIGPDNSVYFTDNAGGGRVRRIDKNGIITTVAGTGVCNGPLVAGTLAAQANLCFIDFAVAKDGSVYLEDRTEVYRVGADGILARIVGDGTYTRCPSSTKSFVCAEGKSANAPGVFHQLRGIAVAEDGALYVANREFSVVNGMVIYRIGTDGIIHRVAGNGNASGPLLNGVLATTTSIVSFHTDLGVAADGTLYYTEEAGWVYSVDGNGLLRIQAGCVSSPGSATCVRNGGGRATLTTLDAPRALSFGPDGRFYILDRIARRVDAPLPALGINASTVASEDGSELYVFDPTGRHLHTLDALLGTTIYDFAYDAAGLLSMITDVDGNVIQVEHDGAGAPTAIIAPFGQRTELTINSSKYLATVTRPGEPATILSYSTDGLLQRLTDANGNLHNFTYDDRGLLMRDDDPAGGFKTLVRAVTDSSSAVTVTTALGTSITHGTTNLSTGATRRTSIDGAGQVSTSLSEINGTVSLTAANSAITTLATGLDPRFGMQNPVLSRMTIRTPGGVLATVTRGRRTVLSDPANPFSMVSQTDSLIVNGGVFRTAYAAAPRTFTAVTPLGRSNSERLDTLGHVIEKTTSEITPIQYQYNPRGQLAQVTQGSRQWSYTYNAQGRLARTTDPLMRGSQFFYDSVDRLARQVLTDGRQVLYAYDSSGNLSSVTPPGRPAHRFQYNSLNLLTSYDPPSLSSGVGSTTYKYDLDSKLIQVTRADGQTIGFGYDGAGRPSTVTVPGGAVQYTYDPGTGAMTGATGPYGGSLAFSYDGSLLTQAMWAGEVQGAVTATYNNDFRVSGLSVNGGATVGFVYDADGLLSQAGTLMITRSVTNGLITSTALGPVATTEAYTPLGELAEETTRVSDSVLFDIANVRDGVGRISQLTEAISGITTTTAYTYDVAGRLSEVRENGALRAVYEYDANGNRLRVTRPSGVEADTYDDEDRLLSHGIATYTYTRNGDLSTKTVGSEVTRYEYEVLGNLHRVDAPDGTVIEYVLDGMGRRIGRKVNGILVQGFLYQGQLNPIAELDGAGNVISEFVYGTRSNVPDYMIKAGIAYRIVTDHLGSVRFVVRVTDGAIIQQLTYDEFGRELVNTNQGFQPFGFGGGLPDQHTGFVRIGARDYDPNVGRWTTKDPIGFHGGLAFYTYAGNNPVNYSDPSGTCVDASGNWRPCRVTWDPQARDHNVAQRVLDYVQDIADAADVDLNLSSGRRAAGADCSASRHDCGLAVDINKINGTRVGLGKYDVNPDALDLIERVQGIALGCPAVRENFGPKGLWKSPEFGGSQELRGGVFDDASFFVNDRAAQLWREHQNHIHLSFY